MWHYHSMYTIGTAVVTGIDNILEMLQWANLTMRIAAPVSEGECFIWLRRALRHWQAQITLRGDTRLCIPTRPSYRTSWTFILCPVLSYTELKSRSNINNNYSIERYVYKIILSRIQLILIRYSYSTEPNVPKEVHEKMDGIRKSYLLLINNYRLISVSAV